MTIVLVDTTILLEVLNVPGRNSRHQEISTEFAKCIEDASIVLVLPFAAIVETGNHIARVDDGRQRRSCAERLVQQVIMALDEEVPGTIAPLPELGVVRHWLQRFPDEAMRGLGIADLSIVAEWERQCVRWSRRRTRIWSLDQHLQGYDRKP